MQFSVNGIRANYSAEDVTDLSSIDLLMIARAPLAKIYTYIYLAVELEGGWEKIQDTIQVPRLKLFI